MPRGVAKVLAIAAAVGRPGVLVLPQSLISGVLPARFPCRVRLKLQHRFPFVATTSAGSMKAAVLRTGSRCERAQPRSAGGFTTVWLIFVLPRASG